MGLLLSCLACLAALVPLAATAEPSVEPAPAEAEPEFVGDPNLPWLDNPYYKVDVSLRPRIELAKIDGFDESQAYTIRTHAGLLLKSWHGFSAYGQLENVWSLNDSSYNDGTKTASNDTVIADPETTELNKAWLQLERDDLLQQFDPDWPAVNMRARGGREDVVFDDARFLGNVIWRQNEQTMDSARGETDFGIEGLTATYVYMWHINRIYGDKGGPTTQDYSSDSHLAHVHYNGIENFEISTFAYLLDFRNDSPTNSSNSYGFRAKGNVAFDDTWSLDYVGSYAVQTEAAKNPTNYTAHYTWVSGDVVNSDWGKVGVVYEMLGSDDGDHQFVTPLATAHKFNGFDDAFLDNGGPKGLQDLFLRVSPKLPWKLKGTLAYHEFWRADGGAHLGRELDGVISRAFNEYVTALFKFAVFDGKQGDRADRWRTWFQVTFSY